MHPTQSHQSKAKHLKRKKGLMSSVKGVSHVSRRIKRRLCCKLQLWMWRKRREKCSLGIFRAKKHSCGINSVSSPCLSLKVQSRKNKRKVVKLQDRPSAVASSLGGDSEASPDTPRGQGCPLKPCKSAFSPFQNQVTETNAAAAPTTPLTQTFGKCCENAVSSKCSCTVKAPRSSPADGEAGGRIALSKAPRTMMPSQDVEVDCPSGHRSPVSPGKDKAPNGDTAEMFTRNRPPQTPVGLKELMKDIYGRWFFTLSFFFFPLHDVFQLQCMFSCPSRISRWLLQNVWKFHPTTEERRVETPEEEV